MLPASSPRLLVLAALRVAAPLDADGVAMRAGLPMAEAEAILAELEGAGLADVRGGSLPGWLLTPAGRAEAGRLLSDELDRESVRPGMLAAYAWFTGLNARLLPLCTRWQLRSIGDERVVNDHTDPVYDRAIVAELEAFDVEAAELCGELHSLLGRFAGYLPRLERSLDRVRLGDHDWFTSPSVDSYHSVWFELHENLLATLGIERAAERAAEGMAS